MMVASRVVLSRSAPREMHQCHLTHVQELCLAQVSLIPT